MIHEVHDWMLKLDLSDYDIITFDDGLYSQYNHYKHFLQFGKPLYFFISTGIVCPEDVTQNSDVVSCSDAHALYRDKSDLSSYVKWSQIREIYNTDNCFIGGHSHLHIRMKRIPITIRYLLVKDECQLMCGSFTKQNIKIDSFCFPYNEDIFGYRPYLKDKGITKFFGKERIPIEIT